MIKQTKKEQQTTGSSISRGPPNMWNNPPKVAINVANLVLRKKSIFQ